MRNSKETEVAEEVEVVEVVVVAEVEKIIDLILNKRKEVKDLITLRKEKAKTKKEVIKKTTKREVKEEGTKERTEQGMNMMKIRFTTSTITVKDQ